ncbi:MAG: GNAT family N-acetyltransferase [Dehalococcoidia bacterium]|nr:GNAT family N-acetyltransferase [Dehalococcoidia bacterium]
MSGNQHVTSCTYAGRMSNNVQVRPASAADAPFLAWVMQEADRMGGAVGSTDLICNFGEPGRLDFLVRLAVSDVDSGYHYRRFLVAESGGICGAALMGYAPDELAGSFEAVVRREGALAGWDQTQPATALARESRYSSSRYFRITIPGDALRVEWVTTRPEYRGQGLNRRLHDAIFGRSRASGLRTAHVGTAIGNEPAIAAYRSAGFEAFAEARHVDWGATYGHVGIVFFRRDL